MLALIMGCGTPVLGSDGSAEPAPPPTGDTAEPLDSGIYIPVEDVSEAALVVPEAPGDQSPDIAVTNSGGLAVAVDEGPVYVWPTPIERIHNVMDAPWVIPVLSETWKAIEPWGEDGLSVKTMESEALGYDRAIFEWGETEPRTWWDVTYWSTEQAVGDFTGDGKDDVAYGDYADELYDEVVAIYVIDGTQVGEVLPDDQSGRIEGESGVDNLGAFMTSVGDTDGDGTDDLVSNGLLYRGPINEVISAVDYDVSSLESMKAGDVDGDGLSDLVDAEPTRGGTAGELRLLSGTIAGDADVTTPLASLVGVSSDDGSTVMEVFPVHFAGGDLDRDVGTDVAMAFEDELRDGRYGVWIVYGPLSGVHVVGEDGRLVLAHTYDPPVIASTTSGREDLFVLSVRDDWFVVYEIPGVLPSDGGP